VIAAVAAQLLLFVGAAYAGGETPRVSVPEPTTMGLIGVGAAVMAFRAWRKHGK
jgi:hypothetical protein